jgi:hypothetical protein
MSLAISKQDLSAYDHFASASTAPGRPRRYLGGGAGLLPHSCTLFVYKDVPDCLQFTSRSLKTGSGVKCIFDKDFRIMSEPASGELNLVLSEDHHDYAAFSEILANSASDRPALPSTRRISFVRVQDSMETEPGLMGDYGIIESWQVAHDLMLAGYNVVVDLSQLRRSGSNKSDGYAVTSSGPASFAKIYLAMAKYLNKPSMLTLLQLQGTLNAVILKGGHKRGIVTSMMHTSNPLIHAYLDAPTADLDGSHKKGVIIDKACAEDKSKPAKALRTKIAAKVNTESIFLQKCVSTLGDKYAGTYSNVCVGIMLPDRGTCLIWRVNLGLVETREQLVDAFKLVTRQVVSLHKIWHDEASGVLAKLWQPIDRDRQVAVDVVGLANMLKRFGYTYKQFVDELALVNDGNVNPSSIAYWFAEAYVASTDVAQELAVELGLPLFDRLHTVEPAQHHAFELQDYEGATLCRGIWPPFANVVTRYSDVEGSITVDHGEVETLETVESATVFELNSQWQRLMSTFGLPHAISADIYETVDLDWLAKWWRSPQLTAYYQFAGLIDQSFARKTVEQVNLEPRNDSFLAEFGKAAAAGPVDSDPAGRVCSLNPDALEGCSVCAE